jgi:hypothetical protein
MSQIMKVAVIISLLFSHSAHAGPGTTVKDIFASFNRNKASTTPIQGRECIEIAEEMQNVEYTTQDDNGHPISFKLSGVGGGTVLGAVLSESIRNNQFARARLVHGILKSNIPASQRVGVAAALYKLLRVGNVNSSDYRNAIARFGLAPNISTQIENLAMTQMLRSMSIHDEATIAEFVAIQSRTVSPADRLTRMKAFLSRPSIKKITPKEMTQLISGIGLEAGGTQALIQEASKQSPFYRAARAQVFEDLAFLNQRQLPIEPDVANRAKVVGIDVGNQKWKTQLFAENAYTESKAGWAGASGVYRTDSVADVTQAARLNQKVSKSQFTVWQSENRKVAAAAAGVRTPIKGRVTKLAGAGAALAIVGIIAIGVEFADRPTGSPGTEAYLNDEANFLEASRVSPENACGPNRTATHALVAQYKAVNEITEEDFKNPPPLPANSATGNS